MSEMYQRMKSRGINMSWYERASGRSRTGGPIPLDDQECSMGSIYYLKKDGSLFTINSEGTPFKQVRAVKPVTRDTYVCVCCKQTFDAKPDSHGKEVT